MKKENTVTTEENLFFNYIKEIERYNFISGCLEYGVYKDKKDLYDTIDELDKRYDYLTDFNNRTLHKPEYDGIDLTKQIDMIKGDILEYAMIVIVDEFEHEIVDYAIVSKGTKNTCLIDDGKYNIIDMFKKHRFRNMLTVVKIHNHPRVVVAKPSVADIEVNSLLKHVCDFFGYRFGDSMVVTNYDVYSSLQDKGEEVSKYQ